MMNNRQMKSTQARPAWTKCYLTISLGLLLGFGISLRFQDPPFSETLELEIQELTLARHNGSQYWGVWLSPVVFFGQGAGVSDINQEAVNERKIVIREAARVGLEPVGVISTWAFPEFAQAKPAMGPPIPGTSGVSAMPPAVPPLGDREYERLNKIRGEMIESLARVFPEIRIWVIGAESCYYYYSPSGTELDQPELIAFFSDTLREARRAVRRANAQAVLVAHFIPGEHPMKIRGRDVQPREVVGLISTEIASRGDRAADYFDLSAVDFDPALLEDREPWEPVFLNIEPPGDVSLASTTYPPTGGWQVPPTYIENFNTSCTDLLTGYSATWEAYHTDCPLISPLPVSGGVVIIYRQGVSPDPCGGSTGVAVSRSSHVPEFLSGQNEKDMWTVVHDFHAPASWKPYQDDYSHHPGVMLRVNFRDTQWGRPDETRFGTIVYPSAKLPEGSVPPSEPRGYVQFTGDYYGGVQGWTEPWYHYLKPFSSPLASNPWPEAGTRFYRIQILERKAYVKAFPYGYRWETQWAAEAWEIIDVGGGEEQGVFQGGHDWIGDQTVRNSFHIQIPELEGSRILFADATGTGGGIQTERVGCTRWVY